MRSMLCSTFAVVGLSTGVPAFAQHDQAENSSGLTIGDPAPKLEISHVVKGKLGDSFEPGKVYVVEFWATWCGPCRASMPHISSLQEKYRDYDVQMIGVSSEELPVVCGWLTKSDDEGTTWWDKITYTLAVDTDRSVYREYMEAAGQTGIPTSFIVGTDGAIEWIGHPMTMDEPLDRVVRDTWDRAAFKATFVTQQEEALKAADRQAQLRSRQQSIMTAVQDENFDEAMRLLDDILADPQYAQNMNVQMYKFRLLLNQMEKPKSAYAYARTIMESHWDEAGRLNELAWYIVDTPDLPERDLKLAMKAAKRAAELSEHTDGAILDTLARVYYERGDLARAIEWQKKAVAHANGPMAESLEEVLRKYLDEDR